MKLCLYLSTILLLKSYLIICYTTDLEVKIPLISPKKESYLCTFEPIDLDKIYAINFEPSIQNSDIVDYMLLYGCKEPIRREYYWECDQAIPCSQQNDMLLYAWNKDGSPFNLPKNSGYQLGASNNIQYLVLQVHYNNFISENLKDESGVLISYTTKPPKFLGGFFIFNSRDTWKTKLQDSDINEGNEIDIGIDIEFECEYHGDPIIAFAYIGYSYKGGLSSVYRIRNSERFLIAQLNVQQGYTTIPKENRSLIHDSDILVAHTNLNMKNNELLRQREKNQVFTFYLAYYKVNTGKNLVIDGCYHIKSFTLSNLLKGIAYSNKVAYVNTTLFPSFSYTTMASITMKKSNMFKLSRVLSYSTQVNANLTLVSKSENIPTSIETFPLPVLVKTWKLKDEISNLIGNITSIAVSKNDSLVILNNVGFPMDVDLFNEENFYIGSRNPIKENIIFILNSDGSLNKTFGKDLFIMPVRLKTDFHSNSIWVIDIGLHQIFKFSMNNLLEPSLTLGKRLTPGFDDAHFCQPSDVVIMKSFVFVADGYCNHRIIQFDVNGKFLKDFSSPPGLVEVNPLALASDGELLFVAYRYSILVFKTDGSLLYSLIKEAEHLEFHSIAFSYLQGGVLFVLYNRYGEAMQGLTMSAKSGHVLNTWFKDKKVFNVPNQVCLSTYENKLYLAVNGDKKIMQYYIQSYIEEFPNVNRTFEEPLVAFSSEDGIALVPVIVVVVILATPIVLVAILLFIQFACKRKKRHFAIRERELSRNRRYETMFFGCCAIPKYRYSADRGFDKFLNDGSYCSDEDEDENLFTRKT